MPRRFSFQAPDDLAGAVRAHAEELGVPVSEALRDLIRAGLGVPLKVRGYREGVSRGLAAFHEALTRALDEIEFE